MAENWQNKDTRTSNQFFIATKCTGKILQWRITAGKNESGTKKWYEIIQYHSYCMIEWPYTEVGVQFLGKYFNFCFRFVFFVFHFFFLVF